MDKRHEIQVLIRNDETGYWATVAELPGVFAAGATRAELLECLDEAIRLYLDDEETPAELDDPPVRVEKFSLLGGKLLHA
jgi:predicted RNase H-like HicB family nuclease